MGCAGLNFTSNNYLLTRFKVLIIQDHISNYNILEMLIPWKISNFALSIATLKLSTDVLPYSMMYSV